MSPAALPVLLSILAGYVDTAGFLALQGLFTAHVTGNFVTLGAALVLGSSGVVGKLIALPVFIAVVAAARLIGLALTRAGIAPMRWLLGLKLALLLGLAGLAIGFGPFADADTPAALLTGMAGVAAMAVQNAVQRLHMSTMPPTTMMTGNTTQLVVDLVDRVASGTGLDMAARTRLRRMAAAILAFATGCGVAALLFATIGKFCFIVPPLLSLAALLAHREPTAAQ